MHCILLFLFRRSFGTVVSMRAFKRWCAMIFIIVLLFFKVRNGFCSFIDCRYHPLMVPSLWPFHVFRPVFLAKCNFSYRVALYFLLFRLRINFHRHYMCLLSNERFRCILAFALPSSRFLRLRCARMLSKWWPLFKNTTQVNGSESRPGLNWSVIPFSSLNHDLPYFG